MDVVETHSWASGDLYVGECRNDKMEGRGTYTWTCEDVHVGEWRDD